MFLKVQQKGFCCPFHTACVVNGEAESRFNIDHVVQNDVSGAWNMTDTPHPHAHYAHIIKSISSSETRQRTELPYLHHRLYLKILLQFSLSVPSSVVRVEMLEFDIQDMNMIRYPEYRYKWNAQEARAGAGQKSWITIIPSSPNLSQGSFREVQTP